MGGYGSGRTGGNVTAEGTASYVISAKRLRGIPHGVACTGRGRWTWADGFVVDYKMDASRPQFPFFELTHPIRAHDERAITYQIYLTSSPTRFNGRRWWWLCPRSGSRAFKLFLPNGGHKFWSRGAYSLGYACQRETSVDRLMRKARKMHKALGGDGYEIGTGDDPPFKPKWMRWKTYERKLAAWVSADTRADQIWSYEMIRKFGNIL
jgi:hypothetical protein